MNLGAVFNGVLGLAAIGELCRVGQSTKEDTPARRAACNIPIAMLVTELDNKLGRNSPSLQLKAAGMAAQFDTVEVWQRWQACKAKFAGSGRDPRFIRLICNVLPNLATRYTSADQLGKLPQDKEFIKLLREWKR